MPYKRHAPCAEADMDATAVEGEIAVFQILRDIYHLTDDEDIKMKCRIGISMARAMSRRIDKYEQSFKRE